MSQICNECGRSVRRGSGWFVNRVRDFGSLKIRREAEKPYPEGDFMCARCVSEVLGPESFACPLCGEDSGEWDPFAGLVVPCKRCYRGVRRKADAAKRAIPRRGKNGGQPGPPGAGCSVSRRRPSAAKRSASGHTV